MNKAKITIRKGGRKVIKPKEKKDEKEVKKNGHAH